MEKYHVYQHSELGPNQMYVIEYEVQTINE